MKTFKEFAIDEGVKLNKDDVDLLNSLVKRAPSAMGPNKKFVLNITKTLEDNLFNIIDCIELNLK